jgi:hypothetical protein
MPVASALERSTVFDAPSWTPPVICVKPVPVGVEPPPPHAWLEKADAEDVVTQFPFVTEESRSSGRIARQVGAAAELPEVGPARKSFALCVNHPRARTPAPVTGEFETEKSPGAESPTLVTVPYAIGVPPLTGIVYPETGAAYPVCPGARVERERARRLARQIVFFMASVSS